MEQETVSKYPGIKKEKDWEELTADEKIERMRRIIKSQSDSLSYINRTINTLRKKLSKHEHIEGKVVEMKEIRDYDDEGLGAVCSNDSLSASKYF